MANLKAIRKRIASVKSTQKITRAMKLVAGARLNRAQQRILAMRPYADGVGEVLVHTVRNTIQAAGPDALTLPFYSDQLHPLLARRVEKGVLFVVLTSDRGLCGGFNTSICRYAQRRWHKKMAEGKKVELVVVGRRGRDYFRRRQAPIRAYWDGLWNDLSLERVRPQVRGLIAPFVAGEYDAIHLIYNEFKNASSQAVTDRRLLPIDVEAGGSNDQGESPSLYMTEPSRESVAEALVPMYVEISILRALYESMASELGARMTAMDAATKNAADMIARLTLKYNRARQAAITTELMEVIGGAEALGG